MMPINISNYIYITIYMRTSPLNGYITVWNKTILSLIENRESRMQQPQSLYLARQFENIYNLTICTNAFVPAAIMTFVRANNVALFQQVLRKNQDNSRGSIVFSATLTKL